MDKPEIVTQAENVARLENLCEHLSNPLCEIDIEVDGYPITANVQDIQEALRKICLRELSKAKDTVYKTMYHNDSAE